MKLCRLNEGTTGLVIDPGTLEVLEIHAALEGFAASDPGRSALLKSYFDGGEESWRGVIANWDVVGDDVACVAVTPPGREIRSWRPRTGSRTPGSCAGRGSPRTRAP